MPGRAPRTDHLDLVNQFRKQPHRKPSFASNNAGLDLPHRHITCHLQLSLIQRRIPHPQEPVQWRIPGDTVADADRIAHLIKIDTWAFYLE